MRRAAAALLVLCGACERTRAAPRAGPPDAGVLDARAPRPIRASAAPPCRAVAVDGGVHAGALALATGAEIPREAWLALGPGARLVAKDPRTTRETTFRGPGQARACVERREESWLAAGRFESVPGAGEVPGAEEWVVTPLAVVRYAAAEVRVEVVGAGATSVTVAGGVAFVWRADDARGPSAGPLSEGWERAGPGTRTLRPAGAASPLDDARSAAGRCAAEAGRARDLAARLVAPGGGLPDPRVAADQVIARRLARAACAVAGLRAGVLPPSPERAALASELAAAAAAWASLPAP